MRQRVAQPLDLAAALGRTQAEMGGDHAQPLPAHLDDGVDGAALLIGRNGEVDDAPLQDRAAHVKAVAEAEAARPEGLAEDRRHVQPLVKQLELVEVGRIGAHLLQGENVRVDRVDDAQHAVGVVAPIHADAGMDVVGGGADQPLLDRRIGGGRARLLVAG